MSKFINIASDNEKPLVINADSVSVVIEYTQKDGDSIVLHDQDSGEIERFGAEGWGLNADTIIKNIQDQGLELFELPFYFGEKEVGRYFVNPKSVQSIIVSEKLQPEDGSEPYVGLLADVKGYGRVETYKVPVSTLEEFVKKVEAVNSNLMRFESNKISTRWPPGDYGYTIIDTSEIRNVNPNGWDIDIHFNDGMRLDFHLNRSDQVSQAANDYFTKLVMKIQGNGTEEDLMKAVNGSLDNLSPRLGRYKERYRKKLREEFASAITANNPDLIKIQNSKDVYYTKIDQISWLRPYKDCLLINFKKAAIQNYADDMQVYFDNERDATDEMKRLTGLLAESDPSPK